MQTGSELIEKPDLEISEVYDPASISDVILKDPWLALLCFSIWNPQTSVQSQKIPPWVLFQGLSPRLCSPSLKAEVCLSSGS